MFSLGEKVIYRHDDGQQYETEIAGIQTFSGQQESAVMILIPNFMEKLFKPGYIDEISNPKDYGSSVYVDPQYVGQKGYWLSRNRFNVLEPRTIVSSSVKKQRDQDGCACIRCTNFCQMAENNLGDTADLCNQEVKISAVKRAFACYSCRDSEAWWFKANGWTFM